MKSIGRVLLLAGLLAANAWAFEPFVVRDIRVEGLQRISAGTVFNYLPVKVGEVFDEARSAEAIRALFKTGFFSDVRIEREGDVLVVSVAERPAIASISISGNKEIETDQLREALKQIGLAEGRVFDRSLLDKVEQELRRQYFSRGKYGVRIETTVTPLERNRVGIAIDISEGRVAKISQINIVGNKVFSDKDLLKQFQLSPTTLFSFYTKNDQYSKEKLAADLELLRSYYLDRGYINFNIESTQVSISPDKKDIYITINISEGDQYTVKDIRLAGDLVLPEEELRKLVEVKSGSVFSRKLVTDSASKISERLGNEGYAFANVNTIPDIDKQAKEVTLTFFVDPGKRVYVRRINFTGNTRTQDEVLRREMRQFEGTWISTEKVNRSRTRLERLGYFDKVNVETPAVPGTPDQVDVNYSVVERPSGNLMAGIGYSQTDGILLNASITQDNFLGTGRRVAVNFNNSSVNTIYSVSYNNPYYTIDGVSRGFTAYYRETDAEQANVSRYITNVFGGSMNFGIPVSEEDTVRLGFGYENTDLQETTLSPQEIRDFVTENGNEFDTFSLTGSWSRDSRNRAIFPDRGSLQSISAEVALPGSGLQYYKASYRHLWYHPLTSSFTLSLNGEVGYGEGYGGTSGLPFFEHYYAGGPRSVRGFKANTLGPRDTPPPDNPTLESRPFGGNLRTVGNLELIFPAPFSDKDNRTLRLAAFVDGGNVFDTNRGEEFDTGALRFSAGIGLMWFSPLGPLTFSLAQPLNEKSGDETEIFQFTLGTSF